MLVAVLLLTLAILVSVWGVALVMLRLREEDFNAIRADISLSSDSIVEVDRHLNEILDYLNQLADLGQQLTLANERLGLTADYLKYIAEHAMVVKPNTLVPDVTAVGGNVE